MSAPTARTPAQSAAIDRRINELDLRGHTGVEIAAMLTEEGTPLTPQAVNYRLKKLNQSARLARDEHIERELRTLDWAQSQAIIAWEQSKEPAEVLTVEKGEKFSGGSKETKRTEGQTGDSAHLSNVIKASESRRKLLGLDAPTRTQQEPVPPVDWSLVPDEMQAQFVEGSIGLAEIIKYLARG